jgi:hypothetical protein
MAQGRGRYVNQPVDNPNPLRRDTFYIPAYSWMAVRIVTDNRAYFFPLFQTFKPRSLFFFSLAGIWALHCHIQWHVAAGLMMQIVVQPSTFAKWTIPEDLLAHCSSRNVAGT